MIIHYHLFIMYSIRDEICSTNKRKDTLRMQAECGKIALGLAYCTARFLVGIYVHTSKEQRRY